MIPMTSRQRPGSRRNVTQSRVFKGVPGTLVFMLFLGAPTWPVEVAAKPYVSFFGGATVFRDRPFFNGRPDANEQPQIYTKVNGTFSPPSGTGRLTLVEGWDIETGRQNKLPALSAPTGAKGITILTSLWQALRELGVSQANIKRILGLPAAIKVADLIDINFTPGDLQRTQVKVKSLQSETLAKFIRDLQGGTYGKQAYNPVRQTNANVAAVAAPKSRAGDPIRVLADAIRQLSQTQTNIDLSDQSTVRALLGNSLYRLSADNQNTVVNTAVDINSNATASQNVPEKLETIRTITDNVSSLLRTGDFSTVSKEYSDIAALLDQIYAPGPYDPGIADLTRVTASVDRRGANNISLHPVVSEDGRFVAFASLANNLVPGDGDVNGKGDVFLRDLQTNEMALISRAMDRGPSSGDSGIGAGDGLSPLQGRAVRISSNGRFVAFASKASDLTSDSLQDCRKPKSCVSLYLYEKESDTTRLASRDDNGSPVYISFFSMSADARYLVYYGIYSDDRENRIFVRDTQSGETNPLPQTKYDCNYPAITPDGNFILCGGDAVQDLVLFDRVNLFKSYRLVTLSTKRKKTNGVEVVGTSSNQYYLYCTDSKTLFRGRPGGLFRFDLAGNQNTFINDTADIRHPDGSYFCDDIADISQDGRYVAFSPPNEIMVDGTKYGGADQGLGLFLRDLQTNRTYTISATSTDGGKVVGVGGGYDPSFSSDGRSIVFSTGNDIFIATKRD